MILILLVAGWFGCVLVLLIFIHTAFSIGCISHNIQRTLFTLLTLRILPWNPFKNPLRLTLLPYQHWCVYTALVFAFRRHSNNGRHPRMIRIRSERARALGQQAGNKKEDKIKGNQHESVLLSFQLFRSGSWFFFFVSFSGCVSRLPEQSVKKK